MSFIQILQKRKHRKKSAYKNRRRNITITFNVFETNYKEGFLIKFFFLMNTFLNHIKKYTRKYHLWFYYLDYAWRTSNYVTFYTAVIFASQNSKETILCPIGVPSFLNEKLI
jgi:hypothetical protein